MKNALRFAVPAIFILLLLCPWFAGCNPVQAPAPASTAAPAAVKLTARSITLNPRVAFTGQEVNVEAEIAATADSGGPVQVGLTIDGQQTQTRQITLNAGAVSKVNFTYKPAKAGKQSIGIAGQAADLTVLEGKLFKSKLFGFSIYFPGGWSSDEKTQATLTGKEGTTLRMSAMPLPENADKTKFRSLIEEGVKQLSGYSIISIKEITVPDGSYGFRSDYTYSSGGLKYHGGSLAINKQGFMFTAAAETMDALWNDNVITIEASLASFKLPGVVSGDYLNSTAGFSVVLPPGIQALDTGNSGQPLTTIWPTGSGVSMITVRADDLTQDNNPKSYLLSQIGSITGVTTGYTLVSQAEISLGGGAKGQEAVVTVPAAKGTVTFHSSCTIFANRAFIIMAMVPTGDYPGIKSTYSRLVSSFVPMEASPFGVSSGNSLYLYYSEIVSIDPADTMMSPADIVGAVFSGLVRMDGSMKVVPDIAEKWEISADGKTYTFHIRDNAKFQDGRPVTAADFKYSWERACDPSMSPSVAGIYLNDIEGARDVLDGKTRVISGVKAIDDKTLQVAIDGPKPYFLNKLCQPAAYVVDRANVEGGSDWTSHPNGTGPFKVKEWAADEKLILERNESYYGVPAKLKGIVFQIYAGNPQQMYEQGKIDVTGVGISNLESMQDPGNPLNKQFVSVQSIASSFLGFNVTKPPFDDPKVRRAFALAINVDKLIEISLKGNSVRSAGIIPAGVPGYNKDNVPLPYDVTEAKKLISESKYGSADKLPAVTFSVVGGTSPMQDAMIAMWKGNLRVDVKVEVIKTAKEWDKRAANLDLQLSLYGWRADFLDPQNFLEVLFDSKSKINRFAYINPEIDAALKKAAVEPDSDKRMAMYRDIEKTVLNDLPVVPLFMNSKVNMLIKPAVKGYAVYPIGINQWRDISVSR